MNIRTMKKLSHKKKWNAGLLHLQMMPPPNPLIKSNHYDSSNKDFVNINLLRDLMSEKSKSCEFKMALFHSGKPEEFLLFVCNFNRTLEASGTLEMAAKFQYICTLVHR